LSTSQPPVYTQCGLRIRSELDLHLPEAAGEGWDVDVRWGPDIHDSDVPPPGEVIAAHDFKGARWYTATATESGFLLRFRSCGEFVISADLSDVRVRRDPLGRSHLLPILFAGTASALLLALRGETVLHASAVALEGSALAFVGQSGRGKSTVAALLCLDGAKLVTDDVLTVDAGPPVTCVGGASELRLRSSAAALADARPDSPSRTTADDRRAFSPPPAPLGRLPLTGIVIPSPSRSAQDIQIHRLSPSDALFALLAFPRVHGWSRPGVLSRDFTTLSLVVNLIPVYQARIPWGPPFDPGVVRSLAALGTATLTSERGAWDVT
jgi:hypothetical protein